MLEFSNLDEALEEVCGGAMLVMYKPTDNVPLPLIVDDAAIPTGRCELLSWDRSVLEQARYLLSLEGYSSDNIQFDVVYRLSVFAFPREVKQVFANYTGYA